MSMSEPGDCEPDFLQSEAYRWLVRLHSGDMTAVERHELTLWQNRSERHRAAWQQAQRLWMGVETLRERLKPAGLPEANVEGRPAAAKGSDQPWRRPYFAAVAAVMVLLVMIGGRLPDWTADYVTGVGEIRELSLDDGSILQLNTDTAIRVDFGPERRDVVLLNGEAAFKVAKDSTRPFTVSTESGSLRAIGTEFLVRRRNDGLDVDIVEGTVQMQAGQTARHILLHAGQSARYRREGALQVDNGRPGVSVGAWRRGYLTFSGTPLDEALAEIDRYRPGRILLANRRLAAERISGVFRIDQLDQAINALSETTPARIATLTPYLVLVR